MSKEININEMNEALKAQNVEAVEPNKCQCGSTRINLEWREGCAGIRCDSCHRRTTLYMLRHLPKPSLIVADQVNDEFLGCHPTSPNWWNGLKPTTWNFANRAASLQHQRCVEAAKKIGTGWPSFEKEVLAALAKVAPEATGTEER